MTKKPKGWPKGLSRNFNGKRNVTPFSAQKRKAVTVNMMAPVMAQIEAVCSVLGITKQSFFQFAAFNFIKDLNPALEVHDKHVAREWLNQLWQEEMTKHSNRIR